MFTVLAGALALAELVPRIFSVLERGKSLETKAAGGVNAALGVAEKVVDIARQLSGVKDPEKMVEVFRQDQNLLQELKKKVDSLERELLTAEVNDRVDARARDLKMASLGRSNWRAHIMIGVASCGLIGSVLSLMLCRAYLSGEVVGMLATTVGIFGACLKDAFAFEFGAGEKKSHVF